MTQKYHHLKLVESAEEFHQNIWKHQEGLVVNKDSLFPDRCIQCNCAANGISVRKMVFWHNPFLFPLLFISWPFYILLALAFRRHITISVPLCQKHLWQRRILSTIGFSLFPIAGWMISTAIRQSQPSLILSAILSFIVGAIVLGWGRNPIWASKIEEGHAIIKGIHPSLVAENNWEEWVETKKDSQER